MWTWKLGTRMPAGNGTKASHKLSKDKSSSYKLYIIVIVTACFALLFLLHSPTRTRLKTIASVKTQSDDASGQVVNDVISFSKCFSDIYDVNISREEPICKELGPSYSYDNFDFSGRTKYFMYSPSGGLSNQRTEFEYALLLGKMLNRVPILHKIAKHTNIWHHYAELSHESLLPVDTIYDLSRVERRYNFVLTNKTVRELEHFFEASETRDFSMRVLQTKYRMNWMGKKEISANLNFSESLLFLKGPTMYHHWVSKEKSVAISELIAVQPWLRRIAVEVHKQLGDSYDAIHVRMGDYYRHGRVPSHSKFFREMRASGFHKYSPVYIAVEKGNYRHYFDSFHRRYRKIHYSSEFQFVEAEIKKVVGEHEMLQDLVGVVEQLICMLADNFVGTSYSNFSRYIEWMRKIRQSIFPEMSSVRAQIKEHSISH